MHLIDARALYHDRIFRLKEFFDDQIPPYIILSHTWGEEEVLYQDVTEGNPFPMKGYSKIWETCRQAFKRGLGWAWVDTCCIDKRSSAELTENINSMFRYYQRADTCVTFINDLENAPHKPTATELGRCRWFSRGWTLQELIAPENVDFYDQEWIRRGDKQSLHKELEKVTGIDQELLLGNRSVGDYLIYQKMAWAANRKTTRSEDIAYCLLGLFDINMPLNYGEGPKAFRRLQEEIIKSSLDRTIFAWNPSKKDLRSNCSMLAPKPSSFDIGMDIETLPPDYFVSGYTIDNKGLRMTESLMMVSLAVRPESQNLAETFLTSSPRPRTERKGRYFLPIGTPPRAGTGNSSMGSIGILLDKAGPTLFYRCQWPVQASYDKSLNYKGSCLSADIWLALKAPNQMIRLTPSYSYCLEDQSNVDVVVQKTMPEQEWDFRHRAWFLGRVDSKHRDPNRLYAFEATLGKGGDKENGPKLSVIVIIGGFNDLGPYGNQNGLAKCKILDAASNQRLSRYLFNGRHENQPLTHHDIRDDFPEVMRAPSSIGVRPFTTSARFTITARLRVKNDLRSSFPPAGGAWRDECQHLGFTVVSTPAVGSPTHW